MSGTPSAEQSLTEAWRVAYVESERRIEAERKCAFWKRVAIWAPISVGLAAVRWWFGWGC